MSSLPLVIGAAVVLTALASCGRDSTTGPGTGRTPRAIEVVSGDAQSAVVGTRLAEPLVVRVVDEQGLGVPGVSVTWTLSSGGSMSAASATTNGTGAASTLWTLGTTAGAQQAAAQTTGLSPASFTAVSRPDRPASARPSRDSLLFFRLNDTLRLTASVSDQYGNAIESPAVQWASSDTSVVRVDAQGLVTSRAAGEATITARTDTARGSAHVAVRLGREPSELRIVSGEGQTGAINARLAQPLVVEVRDQAGSVFAGVPVSWGVATGGGSLGATSATTDQNGRASVEWTLGPAQGAQSATAGVVGLAAVTFTATATAPTLPPFVVPPVAPPLPPPTGNVVTVSTVAELQSAVAALTSGTTILIQPGVYRVTGELRIRNGVTNVALRGASNARGDVVIRGTGMATPGVNIGIKCENAQNVLIANLSVGEFFWHPIQLQGEQGCDNVHIYNVRVYDAGQQFVKSTVDFSNPNGVDNGLVEYSILEYTVIGPDHGYTEGIDVHDGANWVIRYNLFRNIAVPAGAPDTQRPAVLMWSGSRNTITHSNTFIDCERGIIYGLGPQSGFAYSHQGGSIYNNFIYRTRTMHADAGISVWDSPGTKVFHNTVIQNGTYRDAIEYRFPNTTGVEVKNNLTDGDIRARDGAQAALGGNYTQARPAMFVNAAIGDLRLVASANEAIDRGVPVAEVVSDWGGDPRPLNGAWDIGADELAGGAAFGRFRTSWSEKFGSRMGRGVRVQSAAGREGRPR